MKELNTFRNFLNEGLFSRSSPDKEYESAMAIMNAIESIDTLTTNGHLDANVCRKKWCLKWESSILPLW
jgi:hypothetical protein